MSLKRPIEEKGNSQSKRLKSKQKRLKCIKCGEPFESQEILQKHEKMHEKEIICESCGMKFKSKDFWRTHRKREHTEDYLAKKKVNSN